jgi:hypothetical protein
MDIARANNEYIDAKDTLEHILSTPEFKDAAARYGRFMCLDDIKILTPPFELSGLANLDRTDWALGNDSDKVKIHLTNWYYQEDQDAYVPVRWFTDNEAFRAEIIAKAAAATKAAADKVAAKEAEAREERRAQFLALAEEFAEGAGA